MANYKMIPIKRLKHMDKAEAYDEVISELPELVQFYLRNYSRKHDEKQTIFDRMTDAKNYARYIKHGLKADSNPYPDGFNLLLADFLQMYSSKAEHADVVEIYSQVLNKICKSSAKRLAKDLDVPKSIAFELAAVHPGEELVNRHNGWIFLRALTNRLMALQKFHCPAPVVEAAAKKTTTKAKEGAEATTAIPDKTAPKDIQYEAFDLAQPKLVKKIFKRFFGVYDTDVQMHILLNLMLDKTNNYRNYDDGQKRLWDTISAYVYNAVESYDLETVFKLVKEYGERRGRDAERGFDSARRLTLQTLDHEKTPKLYIVVHPDEYDIKSEIKKDRKHGKKKGKKDKDKGKKKKGKKGKKK